MVMCLFFGYWSNLILFCYCMNLLILRFNVFDFFERYVINRIIKFYLICIIFLYIYIMIGYEVIEYFML